MHILLTLIICQTSHSEGLRSTNGQCSSERLVYEVSIFFVVNCWEIGTLFYVDDWLHV